MNSRSSFPGIALILGAFSVLSCPEEACPLPLQKSVAVYDVNKDSAINALDIQLCINAALGMDVAPYTADVNGDSQVDALDVQLVVNAALGIFPAAQDLLAPRAVAIALPESGASPLTVTLDGSSSSDEWGIASYGWDVDARDGVQTDLVGSVVQHQYSQSSEYLATLTVTDTSGFSSRTTTRVKVDPARVPVADVGYEPIAGPAPLTANFHGEASNPEGGNVHLLWDFGDSMTGTEQDLAHLYEGIAPGAYQATLIVTNDLGASTVARVPITITENATLASDTIAPIPGGAVTVTDHPESPLNGAGVKIPPGGISEPMALTICQAQNAPPLPPQATMGTVYAVVELGPSGARLSQPATVTIPVVTPIDPSRAFGCVYYEPESDTWKGDGITNVRYVQDPAPAIEFETTHFSLFSVGTVWTITQLGTLGGTQSYAFGLNDSAQVVGYSYVFGSVNWRWAYVWDSVAGMTALGTLGGKHSYAFAINTGGAVVGCNQVYDDWLGERHAFVWDAVGGMREVGDLGGNSTVAQDINTAGKIAGYGKNGSGKYRGFIAEWNGSQFVMTALPTLGGDEAYALGINDKDEIVGTAQVASGNWHAFFWDAVHGITDIGTLGAGTQSAARDLNDKSEVVGESDTGTAVHAFLWKKPHIQDLGTLGGSGSSAYSINHNGNVVGTSQTASGDWHAFGWDADEMNDLNDLLPAGSGWIVNEAWGVNQSGDVVGRGNKQAFLMRK